MRVLLDTSVLVAAYISRGTCFDVAEHCFGKHVVTCCSYILDEYQRKLVGKFGVVPLVAADAREHVETRVRIVRPMDVSSSACRDPRDLPILGAAVSGKCRCIITGDKDLLVLGGFEGIDILSPGQFWKYEATHRPIHDPPHHPR